MALLPGGGQTDKRCMFGHTLTDARHGKEATWRSDGSPIKLADEPYVQCKLII